MKKRHEQKLIILSIALWVLFNAPLIFIANIEFNLWGIPFFYVYCFASWLLAILISFVVLIKHYE